MDICTTIENNILLAHRSDPKQVDFKIQYLLQCSLFIYILNCSENESSDRILRCN